MLVFLILVPWALTVGALLFIMVQSRHIEEDDDFIMENEEVVRVAVYKDKAYWVYDNIFYESEITREPDFTTARPIDTMSLSSKELTELLDILDELKEQEKG